MSFPGQRPSTRDPVVLCQKTVGSDEGAQQGSLCQATLCCAHTYAFAASLAVKNLNPEYNSLWCLVNHSGKSPKLRDVSQTHKRQR